MIMNGQDVLQTPAVSPQPTETKKKPLLITLGLLIILGGAVFAGIQIGKKQKTQTPGEILFNQPTVVFTPAPTCGPCLLYSSFPPGWCDEGEVVPGENDECDCPRPPSCQMPTISWKTFQNNSFGFEFRYPEKWIISTPSLEGKHADNRTVLQLNLANDRDFKNKLLLGKNNSDIINVGFVIWEKESKEFEISLEGWNKFRQNKFLLNSGKEKINGISWVKKEVVLTNDTRAVLYAAEKGAHLYLIEITPFESYKMGVADKILATFKFLE